MSSSLLIHYQWLDSLSMRISISDDWFITNELIYDHDDSLPISCFITNDWFIANDWFITNDSPKTEKTSFSPDLTAWRWNQWRRLYWLARPICETETETGGHMSLVNETKTFHTLVLPARPRPRFVGPWSHKRDRDWEQDSLEFKTETETTILIVS